MKSKITNAVTSSPESPDGTTPCNLQDGPLIDPSGPPHSPASPSLWRGGKKRNGTIDIFGPSSAISFANADLSPSLANRLKRQLDSAGSTVYAQTWIERATPLGLLYWAHTASGHRTSGKGYTGWLTPLSPVNTDGHQAGNNRFVTHATRSLDIAGYPTPRADEFQSRKPQTGGKVLKEVAGWATVTAKDYDESASVKGDRIRDQVYGLATVTTRDHRDGDCDLNKNPVNGLLGRQVLTSNAPTEKRGSLNPVFALWLMGFPIAWTACGPSKRFP